MNLQSPLARTPRGFDFVDHQLDIVVEPDRAWRWKDELELDAAVGRGRLSVAERAEIRAEGARAVHDIEANASPFCDGWDTWQAGTELRRPQMLDAWNDLSMYTSMYTPDQ